MSNRVRRTRASATGRDRGHRVSPLRRDQVVAGLLADQIPPPLGERFTAWRRLLRRWWRQAQKAAHGTFRRLATRSSSLEQRARRHLVGSAGGRAMGLRSLKQVVGLLGLLILLGTPLAAHAQGPTRMAEADGRAEHRWQSGIAPYYSSGDYGTGSTTNILYVPLTIRRLFDDGDVTLIIPYVSIESDGSVTLLSGVPNQVGKQGTGNAAGGRGRGKSPGNVQPSATSDDGLGDIVLRGRYYVLDERGPLPMVALTARVKFPTADENQGLGTGEFDEGFGAELTKFFTDKWIGFADAGYTFIGKPADVDLRNQWNYDFGVGYYFTKSLLGSMYYEEWAALLAGQQNPRDVLFALNYTMTPAVRLNTAMQVGLSDGAPDYGITGGLSVRF